MFFFTGKGYAGDGSQTTTNDSQKSKFEKENQKYLDSLEEYGPVKRGGRALRPRQYNYNISNDSGQAGNDRNEFLFTLVMLVILILLVCLICIL